MAAIFTAPIFSRPAPSRRVPRADRAARGGATAVAVLCSGAAVTAVAGYLRGSLTDTACLIVLIAVASLGPLAWRAARGTLDVFEPVTFVGLGCALLFVARPAYESTVLDFQYIRRDLE